MARPAEELRNRAQERWPGASVSRRGRRWIEHAHPTDTRRRMLDVSIGALHYGDNADLEIDTAWQADSDTWQHAMLDADFHARAKASFQGAPLVEYEDRASGHTITFQARQLEYTNDRNDIQAINPPQAVNATVADDVLSWAGAFGTGLDFEWEAQTSRLAKRLVIQSLASLPSPTAQILGGENPVLRLAWQMAYSTGHPFIDGVQWNPNSDVDTFGVVEFRDEAGNVLFAFSPSRAFDGNDEETPLVTRLSRSGPNLFVEVRVPWAWLETAAYPVTVDPTVDAQIADSNEDGSEILDGTINLGDAQPRLAAGEDEYTIQRFTGVTISQGATIDVAYISLAVSNSGRDKPNFNIYAEDVDNAPAPSTTTSDISGRTPTTAATEWTALGGLGGIATYNSPSIVAVIQEIVDRAGWASGNAIAIICDDLGSGDFQHYHHNGSPTDAPRLHVEYTEGGATLDQSAFRWRNDDGSESTATWRQTQNVNDTAEIDETVRLRVQVDAAGDADPSQFQLEYRKQGVGDWRAVEVES